MVIKSEGTGSKFTTACLKGMCDPTQDVSGRFAIDGTLVNVELSRVIAESIYIESIFRDGQSVTEEYTTDKTARGATRVLLNTPLPFTSRTMEFGGRPGTLGNAGLVNVNAPIMPGDDEFIVYRNQINDQILFFPEVQKEMLPLEIMANKISQYAKRVSMDRDASTLAEILAYAFYRSLNDGGNLVSEGDLTQDGAYADLINKLNSKLDEGDVERGAYTFPTEGRTIIGRPAFINNIFSRKSGVILMGGDLAQSMLLAYDLDSKMKGRNYVGANYKGHAMQFNFVSAPSEIWHLAERYLGLTKGDLDDVDAIAVSFDATARAVTVDLGVKFVDASGKRGVEAQPVNIWGHEAFRKSFVIAKSTFDNDELVTLGFSADNKKPVVAPKDAESDFDYINVPVYDGNGAIIGYQRVAKVNKPNAGNIASGIRKVYAPESSVKTGTYTEAQSVKLTCDTKGADIYYTLDGSTPTKSSTKYTSAITVSATKTIKFIAVKEGYIDSAVETVVITIGAN